MYYIIKLFISFLCILQFHEPGITASAIKKLFKTHRRITAVHTFPSPPAFRQTTLRPLNLLPELGLSEKLEIGNRVYVPGQEIIVSPLLG